jgi:hypothetical protein
MFSQTKHANDIHAELQSRTSGRERQAVTAVHKRRNRKLGNVAYYNTHQNSNKGLSKEVSRPRLFKQEIAIENVESLDYSRIDQNNFAYATQGVRSGAPALAPPSGMGDQELIYADDRLKHLNLHRRNQITALLTQ